MVVRAVPVMNKGRRIRLPKVTYSLEDILMGYLLCQAVVNKTSSINKYIMSEAGNKSCRKNVINQ